MKPDLIRFLLISISCICLISCNKKQETNKLTTYIGGQIVNKKQDYILFSHPEKKNDTILLSKDGMFSFECEDIQTQLYTFKHEEIQYIFIEPGDSIMFRLNTVDFDESLAFSGKGAEKNNFLMHLFLTTEQENIRLYDLYKLDPIDFEKEILLSRSLHQNELNEFIKNENPSDAFISIAKANIDFNYYSNKELYATSKISYNEFDELEFPTDFFDYRSSVNLNDTALTNYYIYFQFVNRLLDNLAYKKYKSETSFNKDSFTHQNHKLNLIDSLIEHDHLRDNLLHNNVRRYLAHADDLDKEKELVAFFKKLDHNKIHHDAVDKYAAKTAKINAGNMVPNITLMTTNKTKVPLRKVNNTNSKSVLFFWTKESITQYKEIHVRISELKNKYPEYTFIGINIDSDFDSWKKTVINSKYDARHEFQFENSANAKNALFINTANKAMIITKKGEILEGNSNIFNQNFETLLLGYLNK